jgi:anaerobic selenocysteine-containing dehydrogenase
MIRIDGELKEASWEDAMNLITGKSKSIIEKHSPGAIGFYTSGQLFLEEYYTLGVITKAGIGTPHCDGNTRLCTATSDAALKISFGTDGQPASYTDIDTADCIMLVGHNIASQETVLWSRMLDRLAGSKPPKIIVVDPRRTMTAEKADVHLQPRLGTNVP